MLYTVQNACGEVYGGWQLPDEPGFTAEEWVAKLHEYLEDIEGINGISSSPLMMDSRTREKVDRVVVDIEPWDETRSVSRLAENERLDRVHRTIGMLARGEVPDTPIELAPRGSRVGEFFTKVIKRSK